MIAVIFELEPAPGARGHYLRLAASLRHELEQVDGFVSIERFESLSHPGRLLSLSYWRDEHAVAQWRGRAEHRAAQEIGRRGVFTHYRLRVAAVLRDYGLHDREQVPADSAAHHRAPPE